MSEDLPRSAVRRIGPPADTDETVVETPEPEPVAAPPQLAAEVPAELPVELESAIGAELASSIQRLTRAEGRLRAGGDAEDVHQMRVATRRLRSTLRVFQPALDGPWCDRLRRRLSALADVLGDARDADVMLMRLDERIAALPDLDARTAEPLRAKLEQQCTAARAHLMDHLDGTTHKRLLSTLSATAARPRFADPAVATAADPIEPLIAGANEAWEKLAAAVDALPEEPSADELHRVRLRTKRVRYAAETLAPVTDDAALRFARRAADLQDVLGRIQDARVARSWLRSVGVRATPRVAYVAGLIAGLEGAEEERARGGWRRAWKRLDRKKLLSWLGPTT